MTFSSSVGDSEITLQLALSRSVDAAVEDVQAAISRATGSLPPGLPDPPSYSKVNPTDDPIIWLEMYSDTMSFEGFSCCLPYGEACPFISGHHARSNRDGPHRQPSRTVSAVTFHFDLNPGMSFDSATRAASEIGMRSSMNFTFRGSAIQFQSSVKNRGLLLIIATMVIYLVLGVPYESRSRWMRQRVQELMEVGCRDDLRTRYRFE
jgi:multidrug efflux pump subunit AcrB